MSHKPVQTFTAREEGILQEVNRRCLHPAGLALVAADSHFTMVEFDFTTGPVFGEMEMRPQKAAKFDARVARIAPERLDSYGWTIQPIAGRALPLRPAHLNAEDGALAFLLERATDVARTLVDHLDPEDAPRIVAELVEKILGQVVGPFVQNLGVDENDMLDLMTEDLAGDDRWRLARSRFLVREIHELQKQYGQLYDDEVEKLILIEPMLSEPEPDPENVRKNWQDLERLYRNVQPKMRLLRGDKVALKEWGTVKAGVQATIQKHLQNREEIDAFVAGDLLPENLMEPATVLAALEERLAPFAEQILALERERQTVERAMGPVRAAIAKLGRQE